MQAIQRLNDIGESLWLDHLDRDLLDSGRFEREIERYSVSGATLNPGTLARCISQGLAYNASIFIASAIDREPESIFYFCAEEDLTRASAMLEPVRERSNGAEGWLTLPVSPKLQEASRQMLAQALRLHAGAGLPGLAIELPGTPAGLVAAEEALSAGVPVMVTHVFSPAQYRAAADVCLRALDRRVAAGGDRRLPCFVSVNVGAWDEAVEGRVPRTHRGKLGRAIAGSIYRSYCDDIGTLWADRLAEPGALPLRLVWGSPGGAPSAADVRRVEELAARDTACILSEVALLAFARHGQVRPLLPRDGGNAQEVLGDFRRLGLDVDGLAAALQRESLLASRQAWLELLTAIDIRTDEVHAWHGDVLA